jgi:hypothetical protein
VALIIVIVRMGLINQLKNKIEYQINAATYDPKAEQYAKDAAVRKAIEEKQAKDDAEAKKDADVSAAEAKKKADADAAAAKAAAEAETFSAGRMTKRALSYTAWILFAFAIFAGAIWGMSLAVNLNVYKDLPYKILYAIYGFIFFILVIPYSMLYRWMWMGKKPRYYSLLPLIPRHLEHPITIALFSWLSYKPDEFMQQ